MNTPIQQRDGDREVLQRVTRIETRLTQLMIGLGVGTQAQKPVFSRRYNHVVVPSIHSSLKEILDSIPDDWQSPVGVYIGERFIGTIDTAAPEK